MGLTIRELVTKWGFDVDSKSLTQIEQSQKTINSLVKQFSIGAGIAGIAIGKFISEAGEMEQVETAFEVMLKSTDKAKMLLKDIADFAAKTPFELKGLIQSSKQLLAFNFSQNEIISTMTNLGDIAAGIGKDKLPTLVRAFGKIRVKGKASMEELNMLLEAGVPILDELAKNIGVSNEQLFKMITQGKVSFTDVQQALQSMSTGTGIFAGLMSKQSKLFLGILSNIKDVIYQITLTVGKALLPQAKEAAKAALSFLEANRELIKTKLANYFKKIGSVLKGLFLSLWRLRNVLKIMIAALIVFKGLQLASALGNMMIGFTKLAKAIVIMGNAAKIANLKMAALALVIGALIIAFLVLVDDVIALFQGRKSLIGEFFPGAKEKLEKFINFLKTSLDTVKIWFNEFIQFFKDIGNEFMRGINNMINNIKSYIDFIDKIIDKLDAKISKFPLFKKALSAAFNPVGFVVDAIVGDPSKNLQLNTSGGKKNVFINQQNTINNPMNSAEVRREIEKKFVQMLKDAEQQVSGAGNEAVLNVNF